MTSNNDTKQKYIGTIFFGRQNKKTRQKFIEAFQEFREEPQFTPQTLHQYFNYKWYPGQYTANGSNRTPSQIKLFRRAIKMDLNTLRTLLQHLSGSDHEKQLFMDIIQNMMNHRLLITNQQTRCCIIS